MADIVTLAKTLGYVGIFGIVFAESGLFIGFFLPGDSLLFTAGILASQGFFAISLIFAACALGAILGDSFGYWFGRKVGPTIFSRENSLLFHKRHLDEAQLFYEKYGTKTIILARFMPVIRTFAPIIAGIGQMNYRTFLSVNLIGGLLWGIGMPALGYFLGTKIPHIDRYLVPGILVIILVSLIPPMREYLHYRRTSRTK